MPERKHYQLDSEFYAHWQKVEYHLSFICWTVIQKKELENPEITLPLLSITLRERFWSIFEAYAGVLFSLEKGPSNTKSVALINIPRKN